MGACHEQEAAGPLRAQPRRSDGATYCVVGSLVTYSNTQTFCSLSWGCQWDRKLKVTKKREAVRGPIPAAVTAQEAVQGKGRAGGTGDENCL